MMSDIDPLIRREIQWMALGVLENKDLAPMVIAKVRRQRIQRALIGVAAAVLSVFAIIGISTLVTKSTNNSSGSVATGTTVRPESLLQGLDSKYEMGRDASVGVANGAISKAGGLGDTLGGITATGIKVEWGKCGKLPCPISISLGLENRTPDLVSQTVALGLFIDHGPIFGTSRPVTITSGEATVITFTFDPSEYKANGIELQPENTWQWNWYLATSS